MTTKDLNEYLNYLKKKKTTTLNDHYDVIKASLIFMICLKTVWKEGQNCSNSNRYISGTNCIFACGFLQYDP